MTVQHKYAANGVFITLKFKRGLDANAHGPFLSRTPGLIAQEQLFPGESDRDLHGIYAVHVTTEDASAALRFLQSSERVQYVGALSDRRPLGR